MNSMLMEAYEALQKVRKGRPDDPQDNELVEVMEVLWRGMGEDEIAILRRRAQEAESLS